MKQLIFNGLNELLGYESTISFEKNKEGAALPWWQGRSFRCIISV